MKYLFSFFISFLCVLPVFSQQDTHLLNSKTYFVYPYQQKLDFNVYSFRMGVRQEEILTRDSLNQRILSTEVRNVKQYFPMDNGKQFKRIKTAFLKVRREKPDIFYNYDLPLEEDIIPTLVPLKDGDYVQFYRDLPYVDNQNVLRYRNDVVSAVFKLKNNRLDGFAYWLSTVGDTVKSGMFSNGLKEGPWMHRTYSNSKSLDDYLKNGYGDTLLVSVNYKNGLLNGSYFNSFNRFVNETGFFKDGTESGEWYHYVHKEIQQGMYVVDSDEPVLIRHYFIPEKPIKGKSVIVRNAALSPATDMLSYNISSRIPLPIFGSYYSLYKETEEGLELPEEEANSYPGEDNTADQEYYGDYTYSNNLDNVDFSSGYEQTYFVNGKEYTRNDLIDSVGYEFPFEGIYEEFYPNGKLKLRFEIRDGNLVKEDTVFWYNGNPANIVTYDPDSKTYTESTFDYDRKPIRNVVYDARGNFLNVIEKGPKIPVHYFNGHNYILENKQLVYTYDNYDTLAFRLDQPVTLVESLWRADSSKAILTTFDPVARVYSVNSHSLGKQLVLARTVRFGEEYDNVNVTESYRAGKLESVTQSSGSYVDESFPQENRMEDSILSARVRSWDRNYDMRSDNVLKYNGMPFNGTFLLTAHSKNFRLKSSAASIAINYSGGSSETAAISKVVSRYRRKKKLPELANYLTDDMIANDELSGVVTYGLIPVIGTVFSPTVVMSDNYNVNSGKTRKAVSDKKTNSFDKTIEGQFLDGKPSGTWITKNQFGKVTTEVNFLKGELHGTVRYFDVEYPENSENIVSYEQEEHDILADSFPAKPVYYLARTCTYRNGILNGPFYTMNWMGDTIVTENYQDGLLSGREIERSKLAYTVSNYQFGELDGITQTYLTLPGKDTVLLFDLNFQNGQLQGESKSYHLNGKPARHGFFLSGHPIDDFEAFDTLGFRYQYVKFQFNQPVEEKIWEENQLSVRYTFDWRDSIYFNTSDIAGSSSLTQLLYDLGIGGDEYQRPYYGRPSLVDKTGINYHMTKYYPNDSVARDGEITAGKKTGCWQFWSYEGRKLCEAFYYDTIIVINDSIRFKSKGVLTLLDAAGNETSKGYIIEKVEKYDCAHTDHHEVRMLYTFWEKDTSQHRIDGYVKNYYDNGVLQNEGMVKDGLATGIWKMYDPYGSLHLVGEYKMGKRQGRWLSGDLSQVKYLGDICLNPNLPNLEEIISYQEKLLDISVIYYQLGVIKKREYYGVNLNTNEEPDYYEE